MVTMVAYGSRMACDHPDPVKTGQYWLGRAEELLNGCLRDRHVLPPEQSIDIRFTDFMSDEQATLEAIYDLAGQPFDIGAREAMAAFIAEHPRGRHGEVIYDFADLSLDPDDVTQRLRAYRERFVDA